jgi:hypothetical protein
LTSNASTQQFDQTIEGLVEVVWMWVAIAGLEMGKTVKRGAKGPSGMHAVILVEIEPGEGRCKYCHHSVDGHFEFIVASTWKTIGCRIETGVITHHLAPGMADRGNGLVARYADRGVSEFGRKYLAPTQTETSDQITMTVDDSIQRRLAYSKLHGNRGQGDSIEAFGIGEHRGGVNDSLMRKRGPCHGNTIACATAVLTSRS